MSVGLAAAPIASSNLVLPGCGGEPTSETHESEIRLSGVGADIPPLNYEKQLFHEKQIRSVEANTREDGRRLLAEAATAGVRPDVAEYGLADANRALQ